MYIKNKIVCLVYITVTKASVTRTPIKKLTFSHGAYMYIVSALFCVRCTFICMIDAHRKQNNALTT